MSQVIVDICTSALIKLGAEPINDLNDDTKEARLCRIQYPKVRDAILRSSPWSFALKRVELSALTEAPIFGDKKQFQLPQDCVRWVKMYDTCEKYMIEGRKLITADDIVRGWYITKSVTPDEFDASFSEALAYALAADLCYSITQSDNLRQSLLDGSQFFMNSSKSDNSQEVSPEDFAFDEWENSRRVGRAVYDEPDFI